jgi:hypothetical protein
MNLYDWAKRWNIPAEAIEDFKQQVLSLDRNLKSESNESETAVQTRIRLEASKKGGRLWRNNVGAGMLENGVFIRWGICNDSQQVNQKLKSSDLVGLRPVKITKQHIGLTLGIFVAREVKHAGWKYTGTDREKAQLNFLKLVASLGGDVAFATGEGTL